MPRPQRKKTNSKKKRLDVAAAGALPAPKRRVELPTHVPKRWVKFLVGVFLLPPAWILTQTFFTAFARTTMSDGFWITGEFWFFSLGVILWLGVFFGLPRPVWLYVFGHELTHAVWVMLMGGKVHRFEVTRNGGHILADRTNTWIALAPYFFPIYSVLVLIVYGILSLFWDVSPYRYWLYGSIGFTWAFHLSFTCWMIPKGQPDLHYGGTFFSIMLIYLLNLTLLAGLLILASPNITAVGFGHELLQNTIDLTAQATLALNHLIR